jgi:hypothetical protein
MWASVRGSGWGLSFCGRGNLGARIARAKPEHLLEALRCTGRARTVLVTPPLRDDGVRVASESHLVTNRTLASYGPFAARGSRFHTFTVHQNFNELSTLILNALKFSP